MCCAFLGITKEMSARAAERTDYLRVLALRKEALPLLSLLCKKSAVPVCVKSAEFLRRSPREAVEAFRAECIATDLRAALELASGGQIYPRTDYCIASVIVQHLSCKAKKPSGKSYLYLLIYACNHNRSEHVSFAFAILLYTQNVLSHA